MNEWVLVGIVAASTVVLLGGGGWMATWLRKGSSKVKSKKET